MRLQSIDSMRLDRSWARVLARVQGTVADVPDRLPFEVGARFWGDTPRLDRDHIVQPVQRVMATKGGQATLRPFVRVHPRDLLLYQALVDLAIEPIEQKLGSREEVLAYRLAPLESDDPFESSPKWRDFALAVHQMCFEDLGGYLIEADVSSFFIGVRHGELQRQLLECGCRGDVVRDLGALLEAWRSNGVSGLPQGVAPSSPLGNFYLCPVDDLLRSFSVRFTRYMDDVAILCPSYHEARRILDALEENLYEDGLSLGGAKTIVSRTESALARSSPEEGVDEMLSELREMGDYAPDDEEIEKIRVDQARTIFDAAKLALENDQYRRSDFIFSLRVLARASDGHAIEALPQILLRMPGLTAESCRYLEKVESAEARVSVSSALLELVTDRFHRTQEWVHILRAIQVVSDRAAHAACGQLAQLVREHDHPLVRARALLAWGRQSETTDFAVADDFFSRERTTWLPYAIVAIQDKHQGARDERFARWSSAGRSLGRLTAETQQRKFSWHRV